MIHYRAVLADSMFTLAPFGNNEESLRLYESLESGAVPILEVSQSPDGDFINVGLGGGDPHMAAPFPRVADWSELDAVLEYYDKRPQELDELQRRVVLWWERCKLRFRHNVRRLLDAGFKRAYNKDV